LSITGRGQHFKRSLIVDFVERHNGYVERTTTQIKTKIFCSFGGGLINTIAKALQFGSLMTRTTSSPAISPHFGSLPLGIVKISRNGNNGFAHG